MTITNSPQDRNISFSSMQETAKAGFQSGLDKLKDGFKTLKEGAQSSVMGSKIMRSSPTETSEKAPRVQAGLTKLGNLFTVTAIFPLLGVALLFRSIANVVVKNLSPRESSKASETAAKPKTTATRASGTTAPKEPLPRTADEVLSKASNMEDADLTALAKDLAAGLSDTELLDVMKGLLDNEYKRTASEPTTFLRLTNITTKLFTASMNKEFESSINDALAKVCTKNNSVLDSQVNDTKNDSSKLSSEDQKEFKNQLEAYAANICKVPEEILTPKAASIFRAFNEVSKANGREDGQDACNQLYLRMICPRLASQKENTGMALPNALLKVANNASLSFMDDQVAKQINDDLRQKMLDSFAKAIASDS